MDRMVSTGCVAPCRNPERRSIRKTQISCALTSRELGSLLDALDMAIELLREHWIRDPNNNKEDILGIESHLREFFALMRKVGKHAPDHCALIGVIDEARRGLSKATVTASSSPSVTVFGRSVTQDIELGQRSNNGTH